MQHQKNLNYILLGSQESMMEAIFEKKTSPFYHFGQMIRLPKIPYEDFLTYITERLPNKSTLVAEEILGFSACHPYYTQQLSSQVWEMMKYQKINDDVVRKAVDALVSMHDLDYERLWQNLNRTDRFTLKQLVLNRQPLQNRNQATSTSYSSLLRMIKSGLIVRSTHYEVEDPFFRQWISQNILQ